MIPLLFLKIDFKYSLLLITVQPLNGLNEQEGVVGDCESSAAVLQSLELKIKQKRSNLSPAVSAHAITINGTLTRTLDRQKKERERDYVMWK